MRRSRLKTRESLKPNLEQIEIRGLYFDGRVDTTLMKKGNSSKEDHYVLIREPGSEYIGHVTPTSGAAAAIQSSIMEFFSKSNITTNKLKLVGCDGTNVNTGVRSGIIRLLEIELKRPLQWIICLLHANELPLRHLIEHLDGKSIGPTSFSGPIGKKLANCEQLEVISYQPVEVEFPEVDTGRNDELSKDQQYLLDICNAIKSGNSSASVFQQSPGKMSQARWLTTANRILRLYVSTSHPTIELKVLVEYITKMQKIGVILIAVGFIGFTNADLPANCLKPNLFSDVNRCCYQIETTSYEIAFDECYQKYADTPDPIHCTTECAVRAIGIGNMYTGMNYSGLRKYFTENVRDTALVNFMTKTVKDCDKQVAKMMDNPEYNTVSGPCGPRMRLLHECTSTHAILNCPIQKWKKGDSYCEQILEDIRSSCPFDY